MAPRPSVVALIQQRFSCRSYQDRPMDADTRHRLQDFLDKHRTGPLGSPVRFKLLAISETDQHALHGLGTYGFIHGASGFILGSIPMTQSLDTPRLLEDFGYTMEQVILFATQLGLGTCWLGGTFTRGSFTRLLAAENGKYIPAVISMGYIADADRARRTLVRRQVGADRRLPWEQLFFTSEALFSQTPAPNLDLQVLGAPLTRSQAGAYALPLEMLRLGPSASNRQPWRVLKDGDLWHFYLQRTKGYRENPVMKILNICDLQRMDMGIAMCHFELTARELDLQGSWVYLQQVTLKPDPLLEYTISWIGFRSKP